MLEDKATQTIIGQAIIETNDTPARRGSDARLSDAWADADARADARAALACLPRLRGQPACPATVPCKICGSESLPFDRVDFNKYCNPDGCYEFGFSGVAVDYFRCTACGFLFTTFCDGWKPRDFRDFIYNDDYIKVDGEYAETRPARTAARMAGRLRGAEEARILDYGSGSGAFARCMGEAGFGSVAAFDPYSSPRRPDGTFDIITCFEVIEHTADPRATFAELISYLRPDGCIVIGQTLQPEQILSIKGNWWYLAPRNGHVSTYTEEALELLGREHDLLFYRSHDEFAFAGPCAGRFAQVILASMSPSFSTVRLFAPMAMEDAAILSPDRQRVVWHRAEMLGSRRVRWSGSYQRLQWRAKWPPVSRLRVQIPLAEEVVGDFARGCVLSLDGVEAGVQRIRGDLAAEFDVDGKTEGAIELVTPETITRASAAGRALGLAIPVEAGVDVSG